MDKCILLSRVSTNQQTLDSQTNELISFAKTRGFSDETQIIIEDHESAIKLDEEHRKGLTKMKEYLSSDDSIKTVICYEISRLSRRQKVLFSIRDYFIENKIQLIILKPYMELLDSNGDLTPTANIVFSLFATISENEMELKKVRMQRGKKQKKADGKLASGRPVFGYTTDDKDNIIKDEEESFYVLQIFQMYVSGKSGSEIAKEMLEKGVIPCDNIEAAFTFIGRVLRNKRYIGNNEGFDTIYPQIIGTELFNQAREIAKSSKKGVYPNGYSNISAIYYAKNILICKENKRMLTPVKGTCVYSMYNLNNKQWMALNINVVDSLVWYVVKKYKKENIVFDIKKLKYQAAGRLISYKKKIDKCDKDIKQLEETIERIERRIIEGKLEESRGDHMIIQYTGEITKSKSDRDLYQYELDNITNEMMKLSKDDPNIDFDVIKDDKQIYDIIHDSLKTIWITRGNNKGEYILEFEFKTGLIETYKLLNNGRRRQYWYNDEEIEIEYLNRIERKVYKKTNQKTV